MTNATDSRERARLRRAKRDILLGRRVDLTPGKPWHLPIAAPAEPTAPTATYQRDLGERLPTSTIARPLPESPMVVSYGAGVDSTAILVGFYQRGIRPDMVIFSDTGSEKPETYTALDVMDQWLASVGFPTITRVRYNVVTARYGTLEGNCLQNDGLPSLAYSGHSCSMKWKINAIDDHVWGVCGWQPALDALDAGKQVVRVIGYDAGKSDTKRFAKMDKRAKGAKSFTPWANWYPLQDWKWTREECKDAIRSEPTLAALFLDAIGQACPVKSACFFCPASKPLEVEELAINHPDLALRAAVMEFRAETGKHQLTTCMGLGLTAKGVHPDALGGKGTRNWSWHRHLLAKGLLRTDWKDEAVRQGLLPELAEWDAYSRESTPIRERVVAAQARRAAALAALPVDAQAEVANAIKSKRHDRYLRALASLPYPAAVEYVAAVVEHKAAKLVKENRVGPLWQKVAKRVADPVAKKERAEAKRRWAKAIAKAKAAQA